jgi:putative oxidoreductase
MLAYILVGEGAGKIGGYAGVADDMRVLGVDGRLLPLAILTALGGGLLVLFGLKTRWAVIALFGICLLMALFFHTGADQAIELQKNVGIAWGVLALALLGPDTWSLGRVARPRHLTKADAGGARPKTASASIDLDCGAGPCRLGEGGLDRFPIFTGVLSGALRLAAASARGL